MNRKHLKHTFAVSPQRPVINTPCFHLHSCATLRRCALILLYINLLLTYLFIYLFIYLVTGTGDAARRGGDWGQGFVKFF